MSRTIGDYHENSAAEYLTRNGYALIEKNWRDGKAEIDLIAKKDNLLIFVEVKFRKDISFGKPEEKLSIAQQNRILEAAEAYLIETEWKGPIRFDLVAITKSELIHFEDAFH